MASNSTRCEEHDFVKGFGPDMKEEMLTLNAIVKRLRRLTGWLEGFRPTVRDKRYTSIIWDIFVCLDALEITVQNLNRIMFKQ